MKQPLPHAPVTHTKQAASKITPPPGSEIHTKTLKSGILPLQNTLRRCFVDKTKTKTASC